MDILGRLRTAVLGQDVPHNDGESTLIEQAMDLASLPIRFVTSPVVIRAYVRLLVFFFTSAALISVSTTAYLIFYYTFIPQINLEKTIHFQYSADSHPHAMIALQSEALIPQQPYDVSISLHMPLSPINLAAGNFMLDVALLTDTSASLASPISNILPNLTLLGGQQPVYRSRRPAILPYQSQIIGLSQTLLRLPSHILRIRDLDSTKLRIPIFEQLSFPRGRANIPTHAYIEMQSQIPLAPPPSEKCATPGFSLSQDFHVLPPATGASIASHVQARSLQVYTAKLIFRARFKGLRHIVYNYRILSFLVFTNMFYFFAVGSMTAAWATFSSWLKEDDRNTQQSNNTQSNSVKKEKSEDDGRRRLYDIEAERRGIADDSSDPESGANEDGRGNQTDSSTVFPGLGRTIQPLRYPGSPPSGRSAAQDIYTPISAADDDPTHDAEAEDEDDDDDNDEQRIQIPESSRRSLLDIKDEDDEEEEEVRGFARDSGIGTSMESEGAGSAGLTRRRSGRSSGGR